MDNEIQTPDPATVTLATMNLHRLRVQQAIQRLTANLERRALVHDASKFQEDEFAGFSRINAIARHHKYGSEEYKAALKQEQATIKLHYSRNSHHPECWAKPDLTYQAQHMTLLDLIEMTCDWWAAWRTYDDQRPANLRASWTENLEKQRERFLDSNMLSPHQWLVVEEVAFILGNEL